MAREYEGWDTVDVAKGHFPRKHLFIDDFIIDQMCGLKRVLNQPCKYEANPIIVAEKPWEKMGWGVDQPRVVYDPDEKLFKMCYKTAGNGPQGEIADNARCALVCYAQSEDGIQWQKPELGVQKWIDGSRNNNIVLRSSRPDPVGNATILTLGIDPDDPDPERRFKMYHKDVLQGYGEDEDAWVPIRCVSLSPDGIHWRQHLLTDARVRHYERPSSLNPFGPYAVYEQRWDFDNTRKVSRRESDDFMGWRGSMFVIDRDVNDAPGTQFYGMEADPINRHTYAGLHFGMLQMFYTHPCDEGLERDRDNLEKIDVQLAVSRDSIRWHRAGERNTFLPCGPEGSWDAGMVFSAYPIVHGERVYFFYDGHKHRHDGPPAAAIGLATLRVDGYVSVEPEGAGPHRLITRSFFPIGPQAVKAVVHQPDCVRTSAISVNADASAGELTVEVLNHQGDVLPGYSRDECDPIRKDVVDEKLRWNGKTDLTPLRNLVERQPSPWRDIRLRFHLSPGTKLYAFELLDDENVRQ